jgi:hypothetical protein
MVSIVKEMHKISIMRVYVSNKIINLKMNCYGQDSLDLIELRKQLKLFNILYKKLYYIYDNGDYEEECDNYYKSFDKDKGALTDKEEEEIINNINIYFNKFKNLLPSSKEIKQKPKRGINNNNIINHINYLIDNDDKEVDKLILNAIKEVNI